MHSTFAFFFMILSGLAGCSGIIWPRTPTSRLSRLLSREESSVLFARGDRSGAVSGRSRDKSKSPKSKRQREGLLQSASHDESRSPSTKRQRKATRQSPSLSPSSGKSHSPSLKSESPSQGGSPAAETPPSSTSSSRGRGFSTSRSPSSWDSKSLDSKGEDETNTQAWLKDPAKSRFRTMASNKRTHQKHPKETAHLNIPDEHKSQVGVRVLSHEGHAGVLARGGWSSISVDARKSKVGGWAGKVAWNDGTTDVQHVAPGHKLSFEVNGGARAFIQGKGKVMATAFHDGFSETMDPPTGPLPVPQNSPNDPANQSLQLGSEGSWSSFESIRE